MCNKLASRHVRVGLANPSDVPRCDICENAPGQQVLFHLFSSSCRLNHSLIWYFGEVLNFVLMFSASKHAYMQLSFIVRQMEVPFACNVI
jgi:hypothetical protein